MMKNVIDVLAGGLSYWAVGHGLCVGEVALRSLQPAAQGPWTNPFFGVGDFFVTAEGLQTGPVFGTFIFLVTSSFPAVFYIPSLSALLCHHLHYDRVGRYRGADQLLRL
jgi:hypothetical protein